MSSFQDRLDNAGGRIALARGFAAVATPTPFPYPLAYSHWRTEQRAIIEGAVVFDQAWHMTDLYITGPDTTRLLSDTSVNSYANFGPGKAKQYVAVNENGYFIADGILFGLSDDEVLVVGLPAVSNWLQFQAEKGGYDVTFTRDETSMTGPTDKRFYRWNIEGRNALKIVEKAAGGTFPGIKFFNLGQFRIGDHEVSALNHTMGGVPGQDHTGLELYGPIADRDAVLDALLEAGKDLGLVRGGALSYAAALFESGWIANSLSAVYGDDLRDFREWLEEYAFEGFHHLRGSFRSENIEDYYVTPWDLGYQRSINFDHDFIGRAALEKMAEQPKRTKVWLSWDDEDAARVLAESQIGDDDGPAELFLPNGVPTWPVIGTYYEILGGDGLIGIAVATGYTVRLGHVTSLGYVNEADAVDGAQVDIVWGEADGGASDPRVRPHKPTRVRATLHRKSPVA